MVFYSIFSKQKENESPIPTIIADNREKSSLVIPFLLNKPVKIEFQQLPIADYFINGVAIERKTISDFKSSIKDRRMFSQIKNLVQYPSHLLIIEGILNEDIYSSGMHENAFRGFLLSLSMNRKVNLLFTHNAEDTSKYLFVLALKGKPSPSSIRPSRILLSVKEQQQFILEGFPGIGPATAKKLLSRFKSLKNIFSASQDELIPILGKKSPQFLSLLLHAS